MYYGTHHFFSFFHQLKDQYGDHAIGRVEYDVIGVAYLLKKIEM